MTDPMELAGRATAFGTDEHRADIRARLERESPFWNWGDLTGALVRYLRRWTDARHATVYRDRGIWGPSPLAGLLRSCQQEAAKLLAPDGKSWSTATADEILSDLAALTKRARCELSGQGPCLECAECERHTPSAYNQKPAPYVYECPCAGSRPCTMCGRGPQP